MKQLRFVFLFIAMAFAGVLNSQSFLSPNQATITKNGQPFTGKSSFKFAIISGTSTIWSNDGSSIDGNEPKTSIELDVINGIYSVELGSSKMKPLFYELLTFYPNPILITWVATESGFKEFSKQSIDPKIVDWLDAENVKATAARKAQPAPGVVEWADKEPTEKKSDKELKEATNAEGYMNFRRKQRQDANGNIPMDGLLNAQRHISGMPKPKDAGLWNWEWLGPSNIGGRIRAIAINPSNTNTIFIGGVGGGLWKSTNAGGSWTVINDFLPSLAITTIVYDPTNTNIMYASTGEGFYNFDALPGAGIFKSTNGGTSWTQLASTNNTDFTWVNRIAHHPDSTGVLYAATRDPNRIWKTNDGGTTWNSVYTSWLPVLDVKVSPHHPHNLVIAGTQGFGDDPGWANTGDVFLSSNWGRTWTTVTTGAANKLPNNPERCEVTFCESNSTRIYISIGRSKGEIWRSDDSGVTWSQRCTGYQYLGGQQWYDNCIWVDPTNSNRLVVGGLDLYRSTDGGATLTQISDWHDYHNNGSANSAHADEHIIIHDPNYNGSTNNIVYVGNDGGIQKATDILTVSQNSGWTNLAGTSLGITQFHGGAAAPDGSYIIGGTQDNDHVRYKPSGAWSGSGNWYQAETGDGGRAAIDFSNTNNQYSEYTNLVIEKSTDGGNTNAGATSGLTDAGTDNALFIAPFVMDPNNSARLIAGGASIWRTTNSASNWGSIRGQQTGIPKCSAIDIADGNSDIIWVGYEDGHVAKSTNGTNASPTWTRVDNNATALPNRYVTDIAINPNNHNEVYVTFGGYNADNVWFTTDAGSSWQNRSGTAPNDLPAIQVNTVQVHPRSSNWIYIGTDLGVFASEDKGVNWGVDPRYSAQNNELPANAEVAELFWQGDYYLLAATHGRGMYRAHPMVIIYVDKLAAAGGNGSLEAPYQTVTEAVNAAGPGTVISIKSNTYDEAGQILFTKKGMIYSTNGSSIIK